MIHWPRNCYVCNRAKALHECFSPKHKITYKLYAKILTNVQLLEFDYKDKFYLVIFKKSRILYFILLKARLNVLEDFKQIYCFGENARKNEILRFDEKKQVLLQSL